MKRSFLPIAVLPLLLSYGCGDAATSTDLGDIAATSDALVYAQGNIWTTPNADICFRAGGGQVTSSYENKCARAASTSSAVKLATCSSSSSQLWSTEADGTLHNSGKCLQPVGGGTADQTNVELVTCDGSSAQKWGLDGDRVSHSASGRCLNASSNTEGLQLDIRDCTTSTGQIWKIPTVEITPSQRRQIRDSITNTWVAATEVNLTYWDTCPEDLDTLNNLTVIQSRWDGRWAGGEDGHRLLNHNLSVADLDHGRQDWNRGGAVHEFGHILGYGHEQQRRDNQGNVYCEAEGTTEIEYGSYDPESSMNYCAVALPTSETETGYANLSLNDVLGMQATLNSSGTPAYGTREFRRSLWSSGSHEQTDFHQSPNEAPILSPGMGWSSVDGQVELRLDSAGHLGVYRTDLYFKNNPSNPHLAPLWQATDDKGDLVTGTLAIFDTDGTLAIHDGNTVVWREPDVAVPGATLSIQRDGNVVLRDAAGNSVWDAGTTHRDILDGAVGLVPDATLGAGQSKTTASGRFELIMQTDGNLVVYDLGADRAHYDPIWASNTYGSTALTAKMMLDGTLALLDASGARVWTAPFSGRPATFLALQEDGDLVAYEPAKFEVWAAESDTNECLDDWRNTTAGQTCTGQTQSDLMQCQVYLDCYYNNGCSPTTCGSQDDVCGVNTIGVGGMAPKVIADQVYQSLACPADPSGTGSTDAAFEPTFDAPPVMLWRGASLGVGQSVQSESGRASLEMRSSGDLAYSVDGVTRWASGSQSGSNFSGSLTFAGDLQVTSSSGSVLYSSGTDQYMNSYVTFTDTGRISIYRVVSDGADNIGFEF